jgi:CBS domain-containing protein
MVRDFRVLAEAEPLQSAVDELLANAQVDFPVTRDGTRHTPVVGLLTRADLVAALARHGPSAPVSAAMRPPCPPAREVDPAQRVYDDLQANASAVVPVLKNGSLVGLLSRENIGEAVMVRGALEQHLASHWGEHSGHPEHPNVVAEEWPLK